MHYSIVDNDDTLASFAWRDRASVLSRDNDFWRYIPKLNKIYSHFTIRSKNKIILIKSEPKILPQYMIRKIITPVPKTKSDSAAYNNVDEDNFKTIGSPSALTKHLGNPNLHELRAAVYYQMGKREAINELFLSWNEDKGKAQWIQSSTKPDNKYASML